MLKKLSKEHISFFREHFAGDKGLLVSMISEKTYEPFTEAEMRGFDLGEGITDNLAGMWNYEDTWMTMGAYIKSLAYQVQVVSSVDAGDGKRGSDAIFEEIDQFVEAIEKMQVRNSRSGLLTKPYGAKPSKELSIDQYAELFLGFYELSKVAPLNLKKRISNLIEIWADFWIEIDYRWHYFNSGVVFWACQPHAVVCLTMMLIAARITGELRFQEESRRLCKLYQADKAPIRSTMTWKSEHEGYRIRSAALFQHLVAESLYCLVDLWPERKEEWLDKLYQWWKYEINLGTDTDGLTYWCFRVHLPTNLWQPVEKQKVGCSQNQWADHAQFSYVNKCKSGSASAHIAATAVRVAEHLNYCRKEAVDIAAFILQSLDEPAKMKFYIDPDDMQLRDNQKQLGQGIQGKSYVQWLCAYWHGCTLGYWD